LDRGSICGLPDAEFLAEVQAYGGIPAELLADPELLELFLPALRADFALFESYRFRPGPVPDCPVRLYGGAQDHRVTPARLAAWGKVVPIASTELLPGGHFYLAEERAALLASIADHLDAIPGAAAGTAAPSRNRELL
jgi:surfactin synthase thioesterase subunit